MRTKTRRAVDASQSDPFDVSHLVCEAAEREVVAGVLLNLQRDLACARSIMSEVSPEMIYGDATGPLFEVLGKVISSVDQPSRADVVAGLHRIDCGPGSDPYCLMVDVMKEFVGLEPQAARLAKAAVGKVVANHGRRQAIHAAEAITRSYGNPDDVAEMIRQLEAARAAATATANRPITLVDAIDAWAKLDRRPVVPTGLRWFDGPTEGGLPIGGIVAFVAQPGGRKTAMALQLTLAALIHDRSLKAVWGLGELTPQLFAQRTACLASMMLDDCEPVTMSMAADRTKEARAANVALCHAVGDRLAIVPAPLTVSSIEERVIATGAKLVAIDYLQLMRSEDRSGERYQQLEEIIGRFRDLAITRECSVICISSTARATTTASQAGQLAKGASEIDYAAEMIYMGDVVDPETVGNDAVDVTWHCKKARNCAPRDLLLEFDGATQTFGPRGFEEFNAFGTR